MGAVNFNFKSYETKDLEQMPLFLSLGIHLRNMETIERIFGDKLMVHGGLMSFPFFLTLKSFVLTSRWTC